MALGAKMKLGFIDGSCVKPASDHDDLQRWIRCDYMSNGPLVYQLERELSKISQGNLSIASYFNKLKKCWDELHNINGMPTCDCGKIRECTCSVLEKFSLRDSNFKLIQFLMKLNDEYESVRSQILAMDPLPTVNKAYYIVQQIKKQNIVQQIKKQKTSHLFEQCFERLGYPDWYKGKKAKKNNRLAAHVNLGFDEHLEKLLQRRKEVQVHHMQVPTSYATSGWVEAMNKELEASEKNNTRTLTELPSGHKAITFKWVYKTKFKPTNIIERLKARLVVRGFNQKEGLDYKHTFSPVSKLATVKVLFVIATAKQWPLHQLDFNNAFLYGYINEEIYMLPLEGYGQSKQDYSLFVKVQGDSFTATLVYVDDVLITRNTPTKVDSLKKSLDDKFTIKDLGLARYFLSIEIYHTFTGTHLNQRKYILDLLTDAGLTAAKPNPSPLPTNLKLSLDKGVLISDPAAYRRLVGRLIYLTMTRPNISYVVQHLSQIVSSPKDVHLQAAIHLLKYLKGTAFKGLFYPIQPHLQVTGFTNADWTSCLMTRKSLTGYCIFLSHSLIYWKTKKQATLSRSSTESAQQLAANPCFHNISKHMDVDCHFTKEKVQDGFLQTIFIPSHLQLADIMTKALNQVQHSFLAGKLGLSTALT
nr:hypothetical protein [Tanacetum cinerariifolium]